MSTSRKPRSIFNRQIAIPQDHGSWVFLLSPLLIGILAGGVWNWHTTLLVLGAMAAFLLRQPASILVKIYSGRRKRRDLKTAGFWFAVYAVIGAVAAAGLIGSGYPYLLYLALPGLPVFAWHLYLISKRSERKQVGVEIVGSGVLALAAPAGLWVGVGYPGCSSHLSGCSRRHRLYMPTCGWSSARSRACLH
jgi:hypothetical protein